MCLTLLWLRHNAPVLSVFRYGLRAHLRLLLQVFARRGSKMGFASLSRAFRSPAPPHLGTLERKTVRPPRPTTARKMVTVGILVRSCPAQGLLGLSFLRGPPPPRPVHGHHRCLPVCHKAGTALLAVLSTQGLDMTDAFLLCFRSLRTWETAAVCY